MAGYHVSRRTFLKLSATGMALFVPPSSRSASFAPSDSQRMAGSLAAPGNTAGNGKAISSTPDLEVALRAAPASIAVRSGSSTRMWRITGKILDGDESSLRSIPNSYLGPIIRAHKGQRVRLHFRNDLPEASILHWHGLHLPTEMDGHPRYAISPGETYVYDFEVRNRAGTYWYHPHPHGRTGPQVYAGMAGLFLISDDEEAAAGLPVGDYDIPLVIQDRTLDDDNQLVYHSGGMMDQMTGFFGREIWVNGKPGFELPVEQRAYRLRLLNGSNSRIYKLAWDDGSAIIVIGTDGGLLEAPVQRPYVMLAPGERVDLWVDFSEYSLGTTMVLRSLPFAVSGMMAGGMGTMRQTGTGASTAPGGGFSILTVRVTKEAAENLPLPKQLSTMDRLDASQAVNVGNPRSFSLQMHHGDWTLNNRTFEMESVADNEIVQLGTTEVWEFVNQGAGMMGGMGMAQPHPMHIHGTSFQVLEREVDPRLLAAWETVNEGYVDHGWKDTVLLMPGERVRLLISFQDFAGLFLYHCHNLEHEDQGMMRNYRIDSAASVYLSLIFS